MITFEEGRKYIAQYGLPGTVYFLLSTKNEASFLQADTLAGGVSEATGTGYTRASQALPTPTTANPTAIVFVQMSWSTASATNWPNNVKSVVAVTTSDNSGVALAAWDLAATRDMSAVNTAEYFTPTLNLQ
jgi:hypothetical protein